VTTTVVTHDIGGRYLRVADPHWDDPLDASHSVRTGGRWNAPGSFPVLYLNVTLGAARANAAARLATQAELGISFDMLDPAALPVLVEVLLPPGRAADFTTAEGLVAVGLPDTYPLDAAGHVVPHGQCQPVGAQVHDGGLQGIVVRCAAPQAAAEDLELAWFADQAVAASTTGMRRAFHDWYGRYQRAR
jgi:RES domain-containing protein